MAGGRLGQILGQPSADLLDLRELPRAVVLPEPREPTQLTLQISRRLAETLEADRGPVDGMELHERVDQLSATRARSAGVSSGAGSSVVITSPATCSIT